MEATDPANVAISSFLFFFPGLFSRSLRPNDHGSVGSREARCTRKNFWSSSNKSFRRVFSSTTVNKRSRRLWRAALTTGTGGTLLIRRIDGKTSSGDILMGGRMCTCSAAAYAGIREIDWRVCIMRSSSTSSWLVRESAKKLFPRENSDFDRSTTPRLLERRIKLPRWKNSFYAISLRDYSPLSDREIPPLIGLLWFRVCYSTCKETSVLLRDSVTSRSSLMKRVTWNYLARKDISFFLLYFRRGIPYNDRSYCFKTTVKLLENKSEYIGYQVYFLTR